MRYHKTGIFIACILTCFFAADACLSGGIINVPGSGGPSTGTDPNGPNPKPPTTTNAATDLLRRVLGGDIKVEKGTFDATGELIDKSQDLNCYGPTAGVPLCRWRNASPMEKLDELEWLKGSGTPEAARWRAVTNDDVLPLEPYVVLAATPSPADHKGLLISDPIGCQQGEGTLTLRFWTSIAHDPLSAPRLQLCWKYKENRQLKDCTPLIDDGAPFTSATLNGPIEHPFELVLRGENFRNAPEGGLIVVDEIRYHAEVSKSCNDDSSKEGSDSDETSTTSTDSDSGVDPDYSDNNHDGGGGEGDNGSDEYSGETTTSDEYSGETTTSDEYSEVYSGENGDSGESSNGSGGSGEDSDSSEIDNSDVPEDDLISCLSLTCNFLEHGDFCDLQPVGLGANGVGQRLGWLLIPASENPTNPLTGVRKDLNGREDGSFALAAFPDPRQDDREPKLQFSLESPELSFSEPYYLYFKRYMATAGIELLICKNPDGVDCIWRSPPLIRGRDKAQQNREWNDELLRLPRGQYQLYLLGRYDGKQMFNAGQIGLSYLKLYRDAARSRRLC